MTLMLSGIDVLLLVVRREELMPVFARCDLSSVRGMLMSRIIGDGV